MDFETNYNRLFKPILAYVQSRVQNMGAAADIAASVWQKAWEKRAQYDEKKGLVDQWVFTIARNEVNKYFGFWGLKRFFSLTEKEDTYSSSEAPLLESMTDKERNSRLLQAMQTLDGRARELVSLKFFGGFNNRQIAQMTGIGESNVGTIVSRALAKLRAQLEDL